MHRRDRFATPPDLPDSERGFDSPHPLSRIVLVIVLVLALPANEMMLRGR